MNPHPKKTGKQTKSYNIPTVSAIFDDGTVLEMVYEPHEKQSAFVCWKVINGERKRHSL